MDRNEMLANFQACTGIDGIGECMNILEEHDWNLQSAVTATLSQVQNNSSHLPNGSYHREAGRTMLTFSCKLGEITKDVTVDDSSTVGDVKEIASIELGIPLSETNFENWPSKSGISSPSNNTVLSSMQLPHFCVLNVKVQSPIPGVSLGIDATQSPFSLPCAAFNRLPTSSHSSFDDLMKAYKLNIRNEDNNNNYVITCEGSKTFEELRQDVIPVTGISYKNQEWNGFPGINPPDDDCTIASLNLNRPTHNLSVKSNNTNHIAKSSNTFSQPTSSFTKQPRVYVNNSSSEDDEVASLDDELMFSTTSFDSRHSSNLFPEKVDDIKGALLQFQSEFHSRYGEGPQFVADTLQVAIQKAFSVGARQRKLLAVYIHHDQSIQSNVFCSQLISKESIVSYLNEHYITWAWDVTSNFNRERFLQECTQYLGSGVTDTVRKLKRDEFPLLILAQGKGRSCDVTAIIQGNSELNELMAKLIKAVDDSEEQTLQDIKEEDVRIKREIIKSEQEEAYRQSLAADRAKMVAEQEAVTSLEEEKKRKEKEENDKQRAAYELERSLPSEPDPNCGLPISQVRFRAPDGTTFMRSFLASDTLQILINYVGSKGYSSTEYKILKPWPKTNLLSLDPQTTLQSNKIFPQESLIIEEFHDCDT